jgi:hypothetical protein
LLQNDAKYPCDVGVGVGVVGVGVDPQFAADTEGVFEFPGAQFQPLPISPKDVCSASA